MTVPLGLLFLVVSCGDAFEQDFSVPHGGPVEWVGPFPHKADSGQPLLATKALFDLPVDSLVVADANGDGIDDLLTCKDSVGILLGAKNGELTSFVVPANPDYAPFQFGQGCAVTAWKDKTGKKRNVAAVFGNGLSLSFPMVGDAPEAPLSVLPFPDSWDGSWMGMGGILVADIDGDKQGELLQLGIGLPNEAESPVAVLVTSSLGNGAFAGEAAWMLPLGQTELAGMVKGSIPPLLFSGDLDGEEGVDLVAAGGLVILNADITPALLVLSFADDTTPAPADVDGDQRLELATLQGTTCTVTSLAGGKEEALASFECAGGQGAAWLLPADVDHDGKDELAVSDGTLLTVYRIDGAGNATAIGTAKTDYEMKLAGSLNWDGKGWDELVLQADMATFFCALSKDSGAPGACTPHPVLPGYLLSVATPDIDLDGKPDFVGIHDDDINLPPRIQLLLAKDSFKTEPLYEMQFPHPNLGSQDQLFLTFADLAGDSSLDMLIGSTMTSDGPEFIIPLPAGRLPALSRMQRNDTPVSPETTPDLGVAVKDYDGDGVPEALFPDGAWTEFPAPGEPSSGPGIPAAECPSGRLTVLGPIVADAKDLVATGEGHVVRLKMYSNIGGECQDLDEADPEDEIRDILLAPDGRIVVLGARNSGGQSGQGAVTGRIHVISFALVDSQGDGKITHSVKELFKFNCNPSRFAPLGLSSKPEEGYVVSCRDGGNAGHLLSVPPAPAQAAPLPLPPIVSPGDMVSGDFDGDGVKDLVLSHEKGVLLVSLTQGK